MGARTGQQYLEGLRDGREVWLDGQRVADVTKHPSLGAAARSVAALFDLQIAEPDTFLMSDSETGQPVNVSHLVPHSSHDLTRRHAAIERVAALTVGMLGRSPDYVNVTLAGFAGRSDVWSVNGNERGAANLVAYQKECSLRDLALTHAIVNPTIDKSVPEVASGDGEVVLHKVADVAGGIRVSGARALATLAPFADEIFIYPGQPIPRDAGRYALAF